MAEENHLHKSCKIASYDTKFKLEATSHAELRSNHEAGKKFNLAVKQSREWRKRKNELISLTQKANGTKRKQLDGAKPACGGTILV